MQRDTSSANLNPHPDHKHHRDHDYCNQHHHLTIVIINIQGDINCGAFFILNYTLSQICSNFFSNSPFPPSPTGRLEQLKSPCQLHHHPLSSSSSSSSWIIQRIGFSVSGTQYSNPLLLKQIEPGWSLFIIITTIIVITTNTKRSHDKGQCHEIIRLLSLSWKLSKLSLIY